MVVSTTWMPGTEPRPFSRASSSTNTWVISLAHSKRFNLKIPRGFEAGNTVNWSSVRENQIESRILHLLTKFSRASVSEDSQRNNAWWPMPWELWGRLQEQSKETFFFKKIHILVIYLNTNCNLCSLLSTHSPLLSSLPTLPSIYLSSIFIQKVTGFPRASANHGMSSSCKTKYLHSVWAR